MRARGLFSVHRKKWQSQIWWCTSVVPSPGGMIAGSASLGYIVRSGFKDREGKRQRDHARRESERIRECFICGFLFGKSSQHYWDTLSHRHLRVRSTKHRRLLKTVWLCAEAPHSPLAILVSAGPALLFRSLTGTELGSNGSWQQRANSHPDSDMQFNCFPFWKLFIIHRKGCFRDLPTS